MSDQTFQFRWISGKRLMERWGLEHAELTQLCDYCTDDGGIQPYYERPYFGPEGPDGQSTILEWYYEKYGKEDPMNPGFMMCISSNKELECAMFEIEDVEQFEQDHPETKPHIKTDDKRFPDNGIVIDGTAPEKLRIAAEAWQALYKSGKWLEWKKKKKGHKNAIKEWIMTHYPGEVDETTKEQIARIINYNTNGALPKSGISLGTKSKKSKS